MERKQRNRASLNRRRFVQMVGTTGGLTTFTAIGADQVEATGSVDLQDARETAAPYESNPGKVQAAFATHAQSLVDTLHIKGYIQTPSVTALSSSQFEDAKVGAVEENDGYSAHLQSSIETNYGKLITVVQPASRESYAFVEPTGEDRRILVKPAEGQTTQDVGTQCHEYCGYGPCSGWEDYLYDCVIYDTCGDEWVNTGTCCYCA